MNNFLNDIYEMYFEGAVKLGRKRDEWEQKIRDGKVPGTELVKDEPEMVKKIAHDIVLETDLDANVLPDMFNRLSEGLMDKSNGEKKYVAFGSGEDKAYIINEVNDKKREEIRKKYDISDENFSVYMKGFIDRNPSSTTGFKVKSVITDVELGQIDHMVKTNLHEFLTEGLYSVYSNRGVDKELAILSVKEKALYDMQIKNIDDPEKNKKQRDGKHYESIKKWIDETGKAKADDLSQVIFVDQIQRTHAVLNKTRLMGISPDTEIGRFNHNYLKQKNEYIGLLLREGKSVKEVQAKKRYGDQMMEMHVLRMLLMLWPLFRNMLPECNIT